MRHNSEMTKGEERGVMLRLMQERVNQTPQKPAPDWLQRFWLVRQRSLACEVDKPVDLRFIGFETCGPLQDAR